MKYWGWAALLSLAAAPVMAVEWFNLPSIGSSKDEVAQAVASGGSAEGGAAKLRLLDKNTNRQKDFTMVAGRVSSGLPLDVRVRRCVKDVQGVPGQDVAWLDVTEADDDGEDGAAVFSGWMFNFYPDVAALEHPRYELRLVECARNGKAKATPRPKPKPVQEAVRYEDSEAAASPVADPEAPAASDGADPNYVPGVEEEADNPLHDLMDSVAE